MARMGDKRGAYRVFMGRSEGKRPLGRPRHRREDKIKLIFKEWDREAPKGLMWPRIGTGGGRL